MTQSTSNGYSVRDAADRLNSAIKSLENSLNPLISKVTELERETEQAKSFEIDRAELANKLDEAAAREKALQEKFDKREQEFAELARETSAELDSVITEVLRSLGETSDG